ncbi:MAG: SH3 domain-containing protein, partial [Verrucomicrobiota bacterium]
FRRGTGWGAALAMALWGAAWWHESALPDALVVAREAAVRASPSAAVKAAGTLPLGAEVRVLRSFGAWREVARGGQRQGWVEAGALAGTRPGD